jgi:hypothetical protein
MPPARHASAAVSRRKQTTLASLRSALGLAVFVAHAAVDIGTVASVVGALSEPAQHGLLMSRPSDLAQNQGIAFEEVSEIVNYPKAARVDPQSWSFPSGNAGSGNKTMVLAGSTSALKGSTDGGSSWRPVDIHLPDGGAPLSIALDAEGSVGAFADEGFTRKTLTGNGVPDFWLGKVSQGPFKTRSYTIIHTNRSSGSFSTTVDENPNNQVTWGRLPAPTVIFSPSSGGITRYPDGMLLATVNVWFVPPVTEDGHVATMGQPWFPKPSIRPCICPWPYNCSSCPNWAQNGNGSIVAYTCVQTGNPTLRPIGFE